VFLSETGRMLLLATMTFPKFVDAGETANVSPRPVPLKETTPGLFEALLAMETLPLAVPTTFGAKVTLKEALWPGVSVRGSVSPPRLKPVPVIVACEIVTFAVPVSVSVTFWVLLLGGVTLPKFKLVGPAESVATGEPLVVEKTTSTQ